MTAASRTMLRVLGGLAAMLALLAAMVGGPTRASARGPDRASIDVAALAGEIDHESDHVTARELAAWIRAAKPGLRVLDVRADSEFAAYHIPSAERIALANIATMAPRANETLVLYSGGGAHAAQAWVLLRASGHEHVYFLRGGLLEWMDDVMSPTVSGADADSVSALSRYFGGVPRAGDAGAVPSRATDARIKATEPAESIERVRRRGC
jgi:rhodanese-related sulfurtransferase